MCFTQLPQMLSFDKPQYRHQNQEINLFLILLTILCRFCQFPTIVFFFFLIPGSNSASSSGSHTSFKLSGLPSSFWFVAILLSLSRSWHFWRALASYFVDCPSEWVHLMIPLDCNEVTHIWQKYRRKAASASGHHIRRYMLLIGFIGADRNFGHMRKTLSISFLHYKVTVSSFLINKHLVRKCFEII